MENLFFFWLAVSALFFILEIGHPGLFFFLGFSCGAVYAGIATLFGLSLITQCFLFLTMSIAHLYAIKHFVRGSMVKKHAPATNVYALQGKQGIVKQSITPESPGLVIIDRQVWSARSINNDTIAAGDFVEVINTQGCHIIVRRLS